MPDANDVFFFIFVVEKMGVTFDCNDDNSRCDISHALTVSNVLKLSHSYIHLS